MPLWKIAWRSIQQRALASTLTTASMALGVMLVVAVLLVHGVVTDSFRSNSSLGYNMIVGAKGGKLQLVLNTVYYLSQPVENIPYAYYQEFLSAEDRGDGRNGEFYGVDLAGQPMLAIPVCLGDYYKNYRVVGTDTQMFDDLVYDPDRNKKFEFAAGRNFVYESEQNGFFECVVGAVVAREQKLKLGDKIMPSHAAPEGEGHAHEHDLFTVVGILRPSGTPNDRAVFVNMEGFYLISDHAKPIEEHDEHDHAHEHPADHDHKSEAKPPQPTSETPPAEEQPASPSADKSSDESSAAKDPAAETCGADPVAAEPAAKPADAHAEHAHDHHDHDHHDHDHDHHHVHRDPLPIAQREVTAVLVRSDPLASMYMVNRINEGQTAQAVMPVSEIYGLLELIVRPVQMLLLAITVMICVVSGISILVSIYNSMSERKHEIAVMRALGAGRETVLWIVLLESIFLSLGGGVIGWLGGHALVALVSPWIEARTGVAVGLAGQLQQYYLLLVHPDLNSSTFIELLLIPGLILLAVIVGFLPALAAYRTDVAKALSASP